MKILFLKPHRVVLEAENHREREELVQFEAWLKEQVELDPMYREWWEGDYEE